MAETIDNKKGQLMECYGSSMEAYAVQTPHWINIVDGLYKASVAL